MSLRDDEKRIWRQAIIDIPSRLSDAVSAALIKLDVLGFEIIDDETRAMVGSMSRIRHQTTLVASFDPRPGLEQEVTSAISTLASLESAAVEIEVAWRDVEQEDWNAAFKAQWQPMMLTATAVVIPSWCTEWPTADLEIFIDPGTAFGTGTHETTQLCAVAIEAFVADRQDVSELSMLDVGTGSGILSFLALKLGMRDVVGTEIDPAAARAAQENAERNECDDRFTATLDKPDALGHQFDLVVANMLVEPLLILAVSIDRAMRNGASLLLSGILENQVPAVVEKYSALGLTLKNRSQCGIWILLEFFKSP